MTWAQHVAEARIMWGTDATHKLGDVGRPSGDFFYVDSEDDDHYYGSWLTGFGLINVAFPKTTSRDISRIERDWLTAHPVVLQ